MAHTLMVSNEVYARLKMMKEDNSFSELILTLIEESSSKKIGNELVRFFGVLKKETEYDKILNCMRKEWALWTKKYA